MNVGDTFPAKQVRGKKCSKCGDAVFKTFPNGVVIETSTVVAVTDYGATVKDAYHCPACGTWEFKTKQVTKDGIEKTSSNQTESHNYTVRFDARADTTTDSSDKSRKKKRNRR